MAGASESETDEPYFLVTPRLLCHMTEIPTEIPSKAGPGTPSFLEANLSPNSLILGLSAQHLKKGQGATAGS